ncbi:unnamed protein product [Arabidopsis halleri]
MDDDVLLDYLNEDEKMIEPTWFMPIIPTILVNGSQGIGAGWNNFIPNYNPRDIVANVWRLPNGQSMVPMDPWYRGFRGTIEKTASNEGDSTYTITGLYEEVDDTTLRITELPIRMWTNDYKKFLFSIKTDHGRPFIQNMLAARQEGFLKKFNLTTTIATSNMHLFNKEVLEEFFDLRLEYYEKRKEIMLKNLELELLKLESKVKFIRGFLSGEIRIFNRKKADIARELRQRGFTPVTSSEEGHKIDKTKEQVEYLKKATPRSLWLRDLESLDMELDKLDLKDAQDEEGRNAWCQRDHREGQ